MDLRRDRRHRRRHPRDRRRWRLSTLALDGATAVVTGASSGIGAATVEALAAKGARVVAVARRADRLRDVVERCAGAEHLVADVAAPDTPERVLSMAEGRVDVLVNNAGIGLHRPALECTLEEVERVFDVNFRAPVRLTLAVLPGMVERGSGAIVNVTSISGHIPSPQETAYGASKAALSRWSHGLSIELARTGVTVGEVSPGPIDTEIWEHVGWRYGGKLFPAIQVADAIVTAATEGRVHATVPARFGLPPVLYALAGRPVRWGLRRFGEAVAGR